MSKLDWIAVDWGTTHLRAWGMDADHQILFHAASDKGMGALEAGGFSPALSDLVGEHLEDQCGSVDVVACGMVGSRQGWVEAPYRSVPCKALGDCCGRISDERFSVHVVSGLSQDDPADVMRGEETQIAGYLSGDRQFDGVLCLPGSHTKWARISAEEIVSFQTVMTGELFATLSHNTVLRHSLGDEGWDDAVFLEAVSEGMAHPARLSSRLFSLRAEGLLSELKSGAVRARLSGLLIGMELAATKPYWLGQKVAVVGASELGRLYAKAITEVGFAPDLVDGQEMTVKGLISVRRYFKEQA